MDNLPQQMLSRILAKYGKEICSDARRCENLLKDLCGSHRREINVLVNAIEERIPLDLLATSGSMPLEMLLNRLENRLEEQTALTADAARWAVESWAIALNLATENEIQTRNKQSKNVAPPIQKAETIQPNDAVNDKKTNADPAGSVQSPRMPTAAPRANSPINRLPSHAPKSSPPINFPTKTQPANLPSVQTQTINQPELARKGFGMFRGCLVMVFLLAVTSIVLFLGVPYAIEVMRETQREKNNEPPRFPVR